MENKRQVIVSLKKALFVKHEDVSSRREWGAAIRHLIDTIVEPEMQKQNVSKFGSAVIEMQESMPTTVTLNGELVMSVKRPFLTEEHVGQTMPIDLFKDVDDIRWPDRDGSGDAAKAIILRYNKDWWVLNFDFRFNKEKARSKFERAREFLAAVNPDHPHVAVYLLWSSAELAVDCLLNLYAQFQDIENGRQHTVRLERAESIANNSGMVSSQLVGSLKELASLKNNARYGAALDAGVVTNERIIKWKADIQTELDTLANLTK